MSCKCRGGDQQVCNQTAIKFHQDFKSDPKSIDFIENQYDAKIKKIRLPTKATAWSDGRLWDGLEWLESKWRTRNESVYISWRAADVCTITWLRVRLISAKCLIKWRNCKWKKCYLGRRVRVLIVGWLKAGWLLYSDEQIEWSEQRRTVQEILAQLSIAQDHQLHGRRFAVWWIVTDRTGQEDGWKTGTDDERTSDQLKQMTNCCIGCCCCCWCWRLKKLNLNTRRNESGAQKKARKKNKSLKSANKRMN